jgi:VanZ family protein
MPRDAIDEPVLSRSALIHHWLPGVIWMAVLFTASTDAYSVSDEIHQGFVASRQESAADVLLDSAGAVGGLLALRAWRQRRAPRSRTG